MTPLQYASASGSVAVVSCLLSDPRVEMVADDTVRRALLPPIVFSRISSLRVHPGSLDSAALGS